MMETGKQSQALQRFLRRVMASALHDGVQVTRIELMQGNRVILPIKVGDYSKPAMMDETVTEIMQAAKDDAEGIQAGAQCTFTVWARFGSSPDGGVSTRFSIYKPVEPDGDEGVGDIQATPAGAMAVGLKFAHAFSKDLMHASNQQHLRLLASLDRAEATIETMAVRLKDYETREYEHEKQRQAALNQQAERDRLAAESERKDAINAKLLESAQVAFGAILPMLAGGRSTKQLSPGEKQAVDWSIKNFATSISKTQIDAIKLILDKSYDGEAEEDGVMRDGPRKFLFMCAMFAAGQAPPPPEEESKRFFDYLLNNNDKTIGVLGTLEIHQRMFLTAHLKARESELSAAAE